MGKGQMAEVSLFHSKDGEDLIRSLHCKHVFFSFSLGTDYP